MYDVLIIGGGPVGNYLARLMSKNYDVAVVERRGSFGMKACTGIVGAESYEKLKLPKEAVLNSLNGAVFHSKTKSFKIWRDRAQAYVLDRKVLEKELAVEAANAGVDYLMLTTFLGFRDGKAVMKHLGKEFTVEAKYYVGADGVASTVAKEIKAETRAEVLKGYEAEVAGEFDERTVEVWIDKDVNAEFFMWVTPVEHELARVGTFGGMRNLVEFLKLRGLRPTKVVEVKAGSVALGWRRPWARGNVALVGDAALQIKPTTAGGIVYGMICAHALKGAIEAGDLKAYWDACKAVRRQISLGLKVRRAFRKMSQDDIEKLFDVFSDRAVVETIERYADFDDHVKTFKAIVRKPRVLARLVAISPTLIRALI